MLSWVGSVIFCAGTDWDWSNAAGFPDSTGNDGPMKSVTDKRPRRPLGIEMVGTRFRFAILRRQSTGLCGA